MCASSSAASSSDSAPPAPAPAPKRRRSTSPTLARRAVVSNMHGKLSRTISIDRLPEEGKRLTRASKLVRMPSEDSVERRVLHLLLRPREWAAQPAAQKSEFPLEPEDVIRLCDVVQPLLEAEPTLLRLSAPVKVFGDLHGQYSDLMRLFESYGVPRKEGGDIGIIDYLFLGDFVDRGKHSLETVVLLLALKAAHPRAVFLVRGNHESPEVNARDGFLHECALRLGGKKPGVAVWRRLNLLFEWLPMAATVNGCILCVHGGSTLCSLEQIAEMQRPLRVGGQHAELMLDLLWSDPTKSDARWPRGGREVAETRPDRVASFLAANKLKLIVRGHECVMDGFQRFAGGKLVTVFSATNYCNRWQNAGAILLIGKDLEITPKMIFPVEEIEDAWLRCEEVDHMRPPTPPREQDDADEDATPAAGGRGPGGRKPRSSPRVAGAPPVPSPTKRNLSASLGLGAIAERRATEPTEEEGAGSDGEREEQEQEQEASGATEAASPQSSPQEEEEEEVPIGTRPQE
ncbi:hypothetical protein EMIHUDRAFT_417293 [Emiliania huxleyi CCMP1516]|uniref:Serine/threonine-protein phosphatase n=2 Tax=Emiliania huxleyi TaxID=2903 RepID=A0A0D3KYP2_EMIH1|nr:hypothetical protein EMIHUDRAFT_417293 [Emiliania huxleyi CCMP1516]EOD40877.1 hypothetical protein EMIHUDRAFT_417293 [Emiliania huxleyi CCMP1516]|eukprot:XP_005793306.1 hypothetical protein EMIHUDRAFT_417293 [Emiliania huxleyi CCMP1516]